MRAFKRGQGLSPPWHLALIDMPPDTAHQTIEPHEELRQSLPLKSCSRYAGAQMAGLTAPIKEMH